MTKAKQFGCDLVAVDATAKRLGEVIEALEWSHAWDSEWAWALKSGRIQRALQNFSDDSSDVRKDLTESVQAVKNMLMALSEGVHSLDEGLAGSLPPIEKGRQALGGQR